MIPCSFASIGLGSELERDVYLWIVQHRVDWLDPIFLALTVVGYAGLGWIVLAAVLAVTLHLSFWRIVGLTTASVWIADLIALGIKRGVGRPRPFEEFPEPEPLIGATVGASMPSGHAATSFAGVVILILLARRAIPLLLLLAVGISFSRMYVGAHYLGDVLAGAALGTTVALFVYALSNSRLLPGVGRRRSSEPQTPG